MNQNPDNELQALYNSFCQTIGSDGDLSQFAKDDLLDIYDYARGIPDDYISEEVVAVGLRRFPKCKDFVKRKALLYHDLGQEALAFAVIEQLPPTMFVSAVAKVYRQWKQYKKVDSDLNQMLSAYNPLSIEDGDIIFMVDIFEMMDRIDVLVDNAEVISKVSQYPATIYSELFNIYCDMGEYEQSLPFVLKLTQLEPFNVGAWTDLANLYLTKLDRIEEAIESAEYALAIDPEEVGAKMIKALALYGSSAGDARRIVEETLIDTPSEPRALYVGAIMDFNEGRESDGVSKIVDSIASFNISQRREAMDVMLRGIVGPLDRNVVDLMREIIESDQQIDCEKWVANLVGMGAYRGAVELASVAADCGRFRMSDLSNVCPLLESLYRLGMNETLITMLIEHLGTEFSKGIPSVMALIGALALYRSGRHEELVSFLDNVLPTFMQSKPLQGVLVHELLLNESVCCRLQKLQEFIEGNGSIKESDFDPFI